MKKLTLIAAGLIIAVLTGCGGGSGSDTPVTDNPNGGGGEPTTTSYKACLTKENSPQYRCVPTCSSSEYELATHDEVSSCESATVAWINDFNKNDTPSTQEQIDGLAWINDIRLNSGLPVFKYSSELERASANHENYIGDIVAKHNVNTGHFEYSVDYPSTYFTGARPRDRAAHEQYSGHGAAEVISYNDININASMDILMSAIYHRQGLMLNNTNEIGIGGVERNFAFRAYPHLMGMRAEREEFLRSMTNQLVVYPYDNQIDVKRDFAGENPDPLPSTSLSGYPISVEFNKHYDNNLIASSPEVNSFKLYREDGTEVTNILVMSEHNDPNNKFTAYQFALFPMDVLEGNETYRVKINYVFNGETSNKVWHFTTR